MLRSPSRWQQSSWMLTGATTLAIAAFCIAAFRLLPWFHHTVNPDAVALIGIARKYAVGNLGDAVNAYWPPLFPWLIVPGIRAGVTPLLAAKHVGIVTGAAWIGSLALLLRSLRVRVIPAAATFAAAIPVALWMSFEVITPDLLFTTILTGYFALVVRRDFPRSAGAGAAAGLLGGLAFLAKAYALPFFTVHFTAVAAARCLSRGAPRRRIAGAWFAGMALAVIVVAPWITALSLHDGRIEIAPAARYNIHQRNPDRRALPPRYGGFFAPSNPTATSAWENPIATTPTSGWNPVSSPRARRHQAIVLSRNLRRMWRAITGFSWLCPVVLAALAWIALRPWRRLQGIPWRYLLPATAALIVGGYLPVALQPRYLWPVWTLAIAGAAVLCDRSFRRRPLRLHVGMRAVVLAAIIAGFAIPPIARLAPLNGGGIWAWHATQMIERAEPITGMIASNARRCDSLYIAFFTGNQYVGMFAPSWDESDIARELDRFDVELLLVYDDGPPAPPSVLDRAREIAPGSIQGMRVFAINATGAPSTPAP